MPGGKLTQADGTESGCAGVDVGGVATQLLCDQVLLGQKCAQSKGTEHTAIGDGPAATGKGTCEGPEAAGAWHGHRTTGVE